MSVQLAVTRHSACPICLAVFRKNFPRCPLDGAIIESVDELPLIGRTIADRYIIDACIGEGGMGQVYRAKHARISRRFAIKVLHGDLIADSAMRERFSREAEAASRLSHPNLVGVVDFGETDAGLLYLVMDYVDGVCLADLIEEHGALALERAVELFRQMAAGLEHAHAKSLIHRDFKPDNVIITSDADGETAKILDFGIARLGDHVSTLTSEGMVMGTPAFMAPEQATGGEVDRRTDLFSLGLVMYQMVAGTMPFEGSALGILRQNIAVEPPLMSERVPGLDVPPALETMVHRLMAKDPADRYQDAGELIADIDGLWSRTRRATQSDGPPSHAPSDAGRHDHATRRGRIAGGDAVAFADTVYNSDKHSLAAASNETVGSELQHGGRRRRRVLAGAVAAVITAAAVVVVAFFALSGSSAGDSAGNSAGGSDRQARDEESRTIAETPVRVAPATTPSSTATTDTTMGASLDAGPAAETPPDEALVASQDAGSAEPADNARPTEGDKPGKRRTSSRKKHSERARSTDQPTDKNDPPFTSKQFIARYNAVLQALNELRDNPKFKADVARLDRKLSAIDYFTYKNPVTGPRDYAKLGRIQSEIRQLRKRSADSP